MTKRTIRNIDSNELEKINNELATFHLNVDNYAKLQRLLDKAGTESIISTNKQKEFIVTMKYKNFTQFMDLLIEHNILLVDLLETLDLTHKEEA